MNKNMGHSPPLWTSSVSNDMRKEETNYCTFL